MNSWESQQAFWSGFGVPAFEATTTIDKKTMESMGLPEFPQLTYQSFSGSIGQEATLNASLWYRSESWAEIKSKADEIKRALTPRALTAIDGGYMWMHTPTFLPFAQPLDAGAEDEKIKRIVLTVEAESLTAN